MSAALRIVLVLASFATTGYILKKIRQSKVRIEHSIFWILLSLLLIVMSLFPEFPIFFAELLGVQSAVNFIYLFIIFVLLIKVFFNSILISKLEDRVALLTQKIAIDETLHREEKQEKNEEN